LQSAGLPAPAPRAFSPPEAEIELILKTIDRTTAKGSRDYALLATMFNTGARVQEIADLRACDLQLTKPFQVRLFGKGRKERYCPLWPQTAAVLRAFSKERNLDLRSEVRVFLNHRDEPLTRFGIRHILGRRLDRLPSSFPISARRGFTPTP
jgi:site-specific recombinase XerD